MDLVSIIVPCYNQGKYLAEALQSVLEQTYSFWECIIVNDGSTDETETVAKAWCVKDSRFIYLYKENGGLSSARNAGLAKAKGAYIQFLDSDDSIHCQKLAIQVDLLLKGAEIAISDYVKCEPLYLTPNNLLRVSPFLTGSSYYIELIKDWETRISIPCHCILFKSSLLFKDEVLMFDESLPNHEDWVFWVQLFFRLKRVAITKITLASYRVHNNSMSQDDQKMLNGFLLACEVLYTYFKSLDNEHAIQALRYKKQEILGGTKPKKAWYSSLKKTILFFLPPVFFWLYEQLRMTHKKNSD